MLFFSAKQNVKSIYPQYNLRLHVLQWKSMLYCIYILLDKDNNTSLTFLSNYNHVSGQLFLWGSLKQLPIFYNSNQDLKDINFAMIIVLSNMWMTYCYVLKMRWTLILLTKFNYLLFWLRKDKVSKEKWYMSSNG